MAHAAQRPNFILILADDVGYGDLAAYGHPYASTPSLDRLAAQGIRFTQFYVTGITCNPSRTGFMTGRFPASFQNYTATRGFGDSSTVTELLARNGYRTAHFGKWHIGPIKKDGTYGLHTVKTGGVPRKETGGRDVGLFSAAVEFIEENQDVPFYLNIWGHIAHPPIKPPPRIVESFPPFEFDRSHFGFWDQGNFEKAQLLIDKYDLSGGLATAMRYYLAEIRALDEQVGRLLDKLDELGLSKRTIVVFSSDQGPSPVFKGRAGKKRDVKRPKQKASRLGSAGGFRGRKHSIYEGGVRTPFIVRWPTRVPANLVNDTSVVSAADWLPTVCALAGIELDSKAERLDGEEISDIWLGSRRLRRNPIFWKISAVGGKPTMRLGDWKIRRWNGRHELYNISEDPFERRDLGASRQDIVDQLAPRVTQWEASLPKSYNRGRVRSPRPPVADAGEDRVATDDDRDGKERIQLNGSGSHDPDGFVSGYVWKLNGIKLAVSQSPVVELELGEHPVTLEVTDYANNMTTDQVQIRVVRADG